MPSVLSSVMIAAASAVAKTFLLGLVGYYAVKRPKDRPYLPASFVGTLSRFSFTFLLVPLIYSGIPSSVSLKGMKDLWFILVAAPSVICVSFMVATLLGKLPWFGVKHNLDFDALRIAATFPNIVALPIIVFPALCEYEVVYESFAEELWPEASTPNEKRQECTSQFNAMVFTYFFSYSVLLWSIGQNRLLVAGNRRNHAVMNTRTNNSTNTDTNTTIDITNMDNIPSKHTTKQHEKTLQSKSSSSFCHSFYHSAFITTLKQIISSPGFLALLLGFITACIEPLRNALFQPGGALRFFGATVETLGKAGSTFANIIAAASLAVETGHGHGHGHGHEQDHDHPNDPNNNQNKNFNSNHIKNNNNNHTINNPQGPNEHLDLENNQKEDQEHNNNNNLTCNQQHKETTSHPTCIQNVPSGETTITKAKTSNIIRSKWNNWSRIILISLHNINTNTLRIHIWYILSKLILTPAIVCAILVSMDCGGLLNNIPSIAKPLILINSAVPGALVVVVILKSHDLSHSASAISKIYLSSYILSVFTIAAWAVCGLILSIPSQDGTSFCGK
eukprot:CAMPEP_0184867338 /NCGR_PEP_ID=MMETSP0580-20130426/26115_1 /TAXON_ID=1118495 /ORGANISM="Dactyliosolen fragilissimus" /LENGTH=560 /DNA_ID=CAMNT_0027367563 /DNA_START=270 /DNA_END=1952 /DNA_ORIENTATION=-